MQRGPLVTSFHADVEEVGGLFTSRFETWERLGEGRGEAVVDGTRCTAIHRDGAHYEFCDGSRLVERTRPPGFYSLSFLEQVQQVREHGRRIRLLDVSGAPHEELEHSPEPGIVITAVLRVSDGLPHGWSAAYQESSSTRTTTQAFTMREVGAPLRDELFALPKRAKLVGQP